jgi:hypothetical protein
VHAPDRHHSIVVSDSAPLVRRPVADVGRSAALVHMPQDRRHFPSSSRPITDGTYFAMCRAVLAERAATQES